MASETHGAELAVPRRRRRIGGRWRPILTAYLLILPAAAFIAVVFIYSLIRLGYVSVHSGNNGDEGPATLTAYRFIVDDPIFRKRSSTTCCCCCRCRS